MLKHRKERVRLTQKTGRKRMNLERILGTTGEGGKGYTESRRGILKEIDVS